MSSLVWLVPLLPLLGTIITAATGRWLRRQSHWPVVAGVTAGAVIALIVLIGAIAARPNADDTKAATVYGWNWIQVPLSTASGAMTVPVEWRVDPLTAMMLATVSWVSAAIAIYSIGYMANDPGYARFFAELGLFVFSMTMLVSVNNFVLLFVFWEGVGLCSYLLIGFFYQRPAAAAAAKKAFLTTRIGDLGFILGVFLIWTTFKTFNYDRVFHAAAAGAHHGVIPLICLLLFCGAVGKSAQFPLHVWLPDAMEGPTPVSALIHAATMVTAGVYLVARCSALFAQAPAIQVLVASIGTFTALLAGCIALTQVDLKRILAYSTISQIGYMFLGVGIGSAAAISAGTFHLFTHAFFKALLFLAAGSVMHSMGGVIDITKFGGLRKRLPITHWTFLAGALALAGCPLLSGFWSKDEVLGSAFHAWTTGGPSAGIYAVLFWVGMVTAFLTAFYTGRAYFLTFWGPERLPSAEDIRAVEAQAHPVSDAPEPAAHEPMITQPPAMEHVEATAGADPESAHGHGHGHLGEESPPVMTYPLIALAVCAVFVGLIFGPTHWFERFLDQTPFIHGLRPAMRSFSGAAMGLSIVAFLLGAGLAWVMYGQASRLPDLLARRLRPLYLASWDKFGFDTLYTAGIVWPTQALAMVLRYFDLLILDGLVNLIAAIPRWVGRAFRPVQNGLVQFYALAMAWGIVILLLILLWRTGV